MIQPKIGKELEKIRKAKGLTQDELAEKCKINVRTIQRIESGDVNPRAYTIKIISSILGYDFFETSNLTIEDVKSGNNSNLSWLSTIFWHIKDLFNLRTNAMKKLTVLSIIFCSICFGLFVFLNSSEAQESKEIDYSKFMKPSNMRGIQYYFPKVGRLYVSNVKDTADYKIMGDLIQEYKGNIYLNGDFVGKVMNTDTVVYNFGEVFIKRSYWKLTSSYGQNIHYFIPKDTPVKNLIVHIDTEFVHIGKHVIMEYDYNIFFDGEFQGKVKSGDSVLYRNEMLELLK